MAYGIGQEIDNLKSIGAARLTKSQAENPDLFTALALQQLTSEQAAAGRQQSMNPQPALPQGNLMQQMGAKLSQTLPQPMVNRLAPGVMQQGQRSMQQPQPQPQQGPQMSQGISGVPANNMGAIGRAGGGIIGYAKGGSIPVGNSNQPIPMLMEKYGAERVNQFIAEQKRLNDKARALAEAGPAAGSMQIEDHKLMKQVFSEKYRDILNEAMGMARGGVVGYAPGGRIKRFEERAVVADEQVRAYLSSLGRDIADFTAEQIAGIKDMLNSPVAQDQRNVLSQVGRGAMGAIADAVPDTAMSQGQIDARKAQLESGRGGIGAALSRDNSGPSVTDQLLAAEQRRRAENKPEGGIMNALRNTFSMPSEAETANFRDMMGTGSRGQEEAPLTDEERAQRDKYNPVAYQQRRREQERGRRDPNYGQQEEGISSVLPNQEKGPSVYDRTKGYMPDFGNIMQGVSENVRDFVDESGLADLDYERFARGVLPRATEVAVNSPDPSLGRWLGAFGNDAVTGLGRLKDVTLGPDFVSDLQEGYLGEEPGTRNTDEAETVASIINNAPPVETPAPPVQTSATYDPMEGVDAVADPNLRRAIEGTQAAPVASPVSGFTADQTDRFGKMMQGIKDENFLNEYVGTISPNGDAGTGASTQKTGLAGLLQKVKPYADKASDIAKILGRGAGASEGFEFSQIAQKSAARDAEDRLAARNAEIADKLFSRQTERDTTGFEQQKVLEEMGIEGRNQELTRRLEAASNIAGQELRMDLYETVLTQMRSGLDAQYNMLVEQLEKDPKFTTGGSDFIPFNERFDEAAFTNALIDLEEEYVKNKLSAASAYTGGSPPSTSTVPATERYSVI